MRKIRVMLAGGGTGGHVFPLVAITRALKERGVEVSFIGPEEFSLDPLREEDVHTEIIVRAGKLRRYVSLETIRDALRLPKAYRQSLDFIKRWHPNIVLGKGSYGSVAPIVASHRSHIPTVLHESDAIPGLANRILARFADHILVSFTERNYNWRGVPAKLVGNPVRIPKKLPKKTDAKKIFGIKDKKKIILVHGGSQGSSFINNFIRRTLPILEEDYTIIIVTGKNTKDLEIRKDDYGVIVREFLNEQELAASYTICDVVISRAGAGSIFEIAAFGKPSILIPFAASAGGHQMANAHSYAKNGAAIVIKEEDLSEETFLSALEKALEQKESRERMIKAANNFAKPNAAEDIADFLISHARDEFWSKVGKRNN